MRPDRPSGPAGRGLPPVAARVREALERTPRQRFLDEALRARANDDDALPIGFGQTLSRLSTVALMTDALETRESHRLLEVGTGSGYQAAVLSHLAADVYSVERIPALALRARLTLHQLGCYNVHVRTGDGWAGWPEEAPFDGILVAAAARAVPRPLLEQLAVGARLVLPLADGTGQELRRIHRVAPDAWEEEVLQPCRFVPLVSARAAS